MTLHALNRKRLAVLLAVLACIGGGAAAFAGDGPSPPLRPDDSQHKIAVAPAPPRLSPGEQQKRIDDQKRSIAQYQHRLDAQPGLSVRLGQQLQAQHRRAAYRFEQDYFERLRQQRLTLDGRFDYAGDPYFYSAPTLHYSRGGQSYFVNRYAVEHMRRAIDFGYQQGLIAGQADRDDRSPFDCRASFAYKDATFGYEGHHVSQDDYSYYFREGFSRGYEDGFHTHLNYGRATGDGLYQMQDSARELVLYVHSAP